MCKGFQSQNGLILVPIHHTFLILFFYISIPKWSDFSALQWRADNPTFLFQSQNGLILVIWEWVLMKEWESISIPKWSDFSPSSMITKMSSMAISIPKWSDFSSFILVHLHYS